MSPSRSFSIKVHWVSWNLTNPGHWGGILRKLCAFQNFRTILLGYLAKTCKINWLKRKPVRQLLTAKILRGGLDPYCYFSLLSLFVCVVSLVQLFATPWTVARQACLSMGFPKQADWSGLPLPSLGGLFNPRIQPASPTLAGRFFITMPPGKPIIMCVCVCVCV